MNPELVVVGAGPAGLAAAISAARHGVRTVLVEKQALPIDKACGEGVLPNGVEALARLDVPMDALRRSSAILAGIRYITTTGRSASSPFPAGVGLGLRRLGLSDALASRARRESSLEVRTGARADVEWTPDGPRVTAAGATWRPRLVVGADGLHSRVRQACGIVTDRARRRRWGARQHFAGTAWTDHVEVHFGDGFEAYVTPVAGGVNIAWLWDARANPAPGAGVCQSFLSRMPALAARLGGRVATDRAQAAGPFRHQPRQRARDGVLLMGDAAGYLDPLTGEGVGLALTQAELFEQHVVPLLGDRGEAVIRATALLPYLRAADAAARPNHELTRLMLLLSRAPALVERAVSALDRDPGLFIHCLDVNIGRRALWSMPAQSILRLGVAMVRMSGRPT